MILGIGSVAVDDVLFVENFPLAGAKMRVCSRQRESGGLAGTALATAAKLGSETAWLGVLGEDELSRFARESLERDGVSTQFVVEAKDARPHASTILVEEGETARGRRTVLSCNDGVQSFPIKRIDALSFDNVQAVFVDHTSVESAAALAKRAREKKIPVIADIERDAPRLETLLPFCSHLVMPLGFAQIFTNEQAIAEILRALRNRGAGERCVAVTDGENGCWFWEDEKVRHIAAFQVEALDTTGCGDVFHGAVLQKIARGEGVENALRFASAAAAFCATQIGGRNGIPTRAQVESIGQSTVEFDRTR